MIIKRSERARLGSLKRPLNAGPTSVVSGDFRRRKKRKESSLDEPFPVEFLGDISVSDSPYELLFGIPGESLPSPTPSPSPPPLSLRPPPVVRTSRGRTRSLPSRFNDSVLIDPWKKEKEGEKDRKSKKKIVDHDSDAATDASYEKDPDFDVIIPDLPSVQDEEERYRACRNFSKKKYTPAISGKKVSASLPLPRPTKNGVLVVKRRRSLCVEIEEDRDVEFVYGDVVWGKKGKKHAAWPGIVIDPMQYAPESIRVPCVPGALCLMFFGYSEVGNERVCMQLNVYNWIISMCFVFY